MITRIYPLDFRLIFFYFQMVLTFATSVIICSALEILSILGFTLLTTNPKYFNLITISKFILDESPFSLLIYLKSHQLLIGYLMTKFTFLLSFKVIKIYFSNYQFSYISLDISLASKFYCKYSWSHFISGLISFRSTNKISLVRIKCYFCLIAKYDFTSVKCVPYFM